MVDLFCVAAGFVVEGYCLIGIVDGLNGERVRKGTLGVVGVGYLIVVGIFTEVKRPRVGGALAFTHQFGIIRCSIG